MRITWLGHASFELQLPTGEAIFLDPWIEGNPKYPAAHEIERADLILVSHAHSDHAGGALPLNRQFGAPIVANHEIAKWLESQGAKTCVGMNKGGTYRTLGLEITMTNAFHSSSFDVEGRPCGGEACGYVVRIPDGRKFYFAGDTCVFGDMRLMAEMYQPELCFLPIGDFYTMGPEQAAMAARLMRPKKIVPMHYGTFDALTGTPERLRELIADLPQTDVWTLEPGKSVTW